MSVEDQASAAAAPRRTTAATSKPRNHGSASPSCGTGNRFDESVARLDAIIAATAGSGRRLKEAWPQLRGLKSALDSGKSVTGAGTARGLPLRIVVQTLKASWHVDDTWPVGVEEQAAKTTTGAGLPGSGSQAAPEAGPPVRPDPDPQSIAHAYRERGVEVAPAIVVDDEW
ncbi:uncharacterized protein PFL1_04851 [Pseudozyma flocculosa PF-1]|uniref:Uncharacterized protein n=2 Tax=Pseudozyma flocculosa TaxID=84751 RepID=A0A5C3F5A6_9BASI|nr:uncharacterized protein PFL1_04851 [Pseudozyma flocculosa PF-1]EPQ27713.1 hypothetical protein PFL1_04851 [Pseudozyma flocculosa PF-1]SPO39146.1 uncharacterized protein PSFLO_04625 [Pseudozyma flocculosa]